MRIKNGGEMLGSRLGDLRNLTPAFEREDDNFSSGPTSKRVKYDRACFLQAVTWSASSS